MTPAITLLGPQRRPTLDRVLSSLGVAGPVSRLEPHYEEHLRRLRAVADSLAGRAA